MSKKIEKKVSGTTDAENTTGQVTKHDFEELKKEIEEIKTIVKDFKKSLKGLVEIQQRLVHERLNVPVPPPPKEYGEETNKPKLKINITSIDSDRIRVSGNTYDFRVAIKEAGQAKFEQATKSWALSSDCLDQLINNLEAANLVRDVDFSVDIDKNQLQKSLDSEGFGSGFEE